MITYTSRKRSFATFAEKDLQDESVPTPPTSSPRPLHPTTGNTSKSPTPSTSDPAKAARTHIYFPIFHCSNACETNTPPTPPPSSPPPKIPTLHKSHSALASTKPKPKRQKLTQLIIDLGGPPHTRCKTCGMEYIPSAAEDRALHAKYHAASVGGVDVPVSLRSNDRWKVVGRVDGIRGRKGRGSDVIVEIVREDKLSVRRYAKKVLEGVERELGAVETGEEALWGVVECGNGEVPRYKVYLYVRGRKCIGLLLALRICKAQRVALDSGNSDIASEGHAIAKEGSSVPAVLGVSRIWVSEEYQRSGIARQMLETASGSFLKERQTARQNVAFSQPTEAGLALIRRWIYGKKSKGAVKDDGAGEHEVDGWLMYDEWDADDMSLQAGRLDAV